MNRAIIFDLDGTLLDTAPDMLDCINAMLTHFSYPNIDAKTLKRNVGNGARNLVKKCVNKELSEEELDQRVKYYHELYTNSGSPKTKLFDGAKEFILKVKKLGYKLAILTNKPHETTVNVYKKYLAEFDFDKVVGHTGSTWLKPDKTATLNILKELDVLPENCYFIGDGETDVLTAINSGTKGIAVLWGYREKSQLIKAGATNFASDYDELFTLINQ